ncbi:nuclease HARBI1 [Trichonephila clavipes]|nr:nuclease HARBI1 [Trichonephila clavipes]
MCFMEELTGLRYRDEILDPYVRPYAAAIGNDFILMDDNARPHRARIVEDYWRITISQKFYREFGFPGIYGALDCSLIKILSRGGSLAETFRCRKGFFALNVQTVSDPNLSIRNIVAVARKYNAAHARARNVVERQYGVWKKRFSCIDTPFRCSLETAETVIVAAAVCATQPCSQFRGL